MSRIISRSLPALGRLSGRRAASSTSSALSTSHGDDEHHDLTSRPPIVPAEPGPGFYVQPSPQDIENDPQLAALNYPQMSGPVWSHSRFLRPWRPDRYWPSERAQFGETLHESEDVLSTLSSDPYTNFEWRNFIVFTSGVAVILGSVTAFASVLVKENSMPWSPRTTGDFEILTKESKDTGADEEE